MRGLVVTVLALAACGDKPGVYLEIHGSASLANVAVYIGQDACSDQGGRPCAIAPPNLDRIHPATPGGTWFRDIDTPFTSSASNGVARVHIEATRAGEVVQLVVLGFDPSGAPIQDALVHDIAVPQGTTKQVTVTLDDAMPVTGNEEDAQPHPDGDYVLDWTNNGAPTDCVLVEHWQGGTGEHVFIVPSEDPDCDGYYTSDPRECDPYWFESSSQASPSQASCATYGHVGSTSTCFLGGDGCIDGQGRTGLCAPVDPTTCLPDAICKSACAAGSGSAALSTCGGNGPIIHCMIFAIADQGLPCPAGGPNPLMPTHGTLQLDSLFAGSSHTCKDVAFSPVDSLYGGQLKSMKLFAPATSTAELDVGSRQPTGPCDFDMSWNGGAFSMAQTPQFGVADITVDNDSHMMLPLRLDYSACVNATGNTVDGFTCYAPPITDSILNCAR